LHRHDVCALYFFRPPPGDHDRVLLDCRCPALALVDVKANEGDTLAKVQECHRGQVLNGRCVPPCWRLKDLAGPLDKPWVEHM